MESYDMIMLLVLAIATLFGAWKGLAWQIASLSSIFASYFIAYQFRGQVAQMINADPPWNMFLAMLILYLGSSFVIWVAFRFVSDFIERVRLKEFDRHAGAVLGLCRGVLWCIIITLFAVTLLGDSRKQEIIHSRSGYYIAVLLDKSHAIMPDEVHEVVGPYIHSLDERLADDHTFSRHHDEGPTTSQDSGFENLLPPANMLDDGDSELPSAAGDAIESWLRRMNEERRENHQ